MERCSALDTIFPFESTEEDASEETLAATNNSSHEKSENENISTNKIEEPSPQISGNSEDQTIVAKQAQIQVKSEHGHVEWSGICEVLIKDETEDAKDEHITDHSNTTSEVVCGICQKVFATNYGLKQHIRFVHEDERNFCCEICTKKFPTSHKLTWHIRDVHEKSGDFVCGFCEKRFFRDCDKVLHERMHTGEKPYQCDDCGSAFHRKEILKRHQNSMHSGIKHPCHLCRYEAKEKGHLRRHLKTVHKNTLLEQIHDGQSAAEFDENNENGCKLCRKIFPDKYTLIEHKQVHTGEKLFSCQVCGNSYPSIAGMKKHMQIKHDEAPEESCSYKHKCEYCHKLFRDRPNRQIVTNENLSVKA